MTNCFVCLRGLGWRGGVIKLCWSQMIQFSIHAKVHKCSFFFCIFSQILAAMAWVFYRFRSFFPPTVSSFALLEVCGSLDRDQYFSDLDQYFSDLEFHVRGRSIILGACWRSWICIPYVLLRLIEHRFWWTDAEFCLHDESVYKHRSVSCHRERWLRKSVLHLISRMR